MKYIGVVIMDEDAQVSDADKAKLEAMGFAVITKKFGRHCEVMFLPQERKPASVMEAANG